jgi:hypothetical protein
MTTFSLKSLTGQHDLEGSLFKYYAIIIFSMSHFIELFPSPVTESSLKGLSKKDDWQI